MAFADLRIATKAGAELAAEASGAVVVIAAMPLAGIPAAFWMHPAASKAVVLTCADFVASTMFVAIAAVGEPAAPTVVAEESGRAGLPIMTIGRQADVKVIMEPNSAAMGLVDRFAETPLVTVPI